MITKGNKRKIEEYFFKHPTTKLRVRHIEREANVVLPSVVRYIKELEKENIVKKTEISGVVLYSANRVSKNYLLKKKLFNIQQLFSSGLLTYLIEELSSPNIVIFGSFSRGEDIETSDIDIYIETPTSRNISLQIFEKRLEKSIQIFKYQNIRKVKNKELANNIINGIILHGYIEVFI